jgi:hypothetical protein
MAGRASGLVAEQMLGRARGFFVNTSSRRVRDTQAQLIVQQRPKLRGDEIRRLRDDQGRAGADR